MENERLLCSICLERFVQPRITKCAHTFCENCLFTFVFETQKNRSVSYFECPVCREHIALPMAEVTAQWIKDIFPLDLKTMQTMDIETKSTPKDTDLADEDTVICAPCKESGSKQKAVKICVNCSEALCKTCCEWHNKFKLFRQHEVITLTPIDSFKVHNLTDKFERCTKCSKHSNRSCVCFCLKHKLLCCLQCFTNEHRLCEILNISDIGDKAKRKADIVTEMYKNAREHIEVLLKLNKASTSSLLSNIDELSERVRSIKDEIFVSLNRQFATAMSHLKEIRIQVEEDDGVGEKLTELKDQFDKKMDILKTLGYVNSNEHVFLLSQTMQLELEEMEEAIREVDTSMISGLVTFTMCTELNHLNEKLKSNDSVVTVNLEITPSKHDKYEAFEDLVDPHEYRVQNVSPVSVGVPDHSSPLFSCINASGENLVLYDRFSSDLYSYNFPKKACSSFRVGQAFSVLLFDNQSLLVSKPDLFNITLINIEGAESGAVSWNLNMKPYGLCRLAKNSFVALTQEPVGFLFFKIIGKRLDPEKHLTHDITGAGIMPTEHFATDINRLHLIQSCQEHNEVNCLSFDGQQVFCFRSPVLECPQGVTLDKNGNIYVCNHSYFKPSVIVLSPEGVLLYEIKDNIPRKPMSICTDTTGKRFWLTSNYIESSFSVYGFELKRIARD